MKNRVLGSFPAACAVVILSALVLAACAPSGGGSPGGGGSIYPTMVTVPAGQFQRESGSANISAVSTFRISSREITRAQFSAVMGTDPSDEAYSNGTDNPVQNVNWYHAIAYCNKLSLSAGLEPVYSVTGVTDWEALAFASIPTVNDDDWNAVVADWYATGYRLPTEMEWMWAAIGAPADGQGGGVNTTGYEKVFAGSTGSNSLGDYAWYSLNSDSKTHAVGTKLPNEIGLYDMSGNVGEWCWDWYYSVFPNGLLVDYRGQNNGDVRVAHGGNFFIGAAYCEIDRQVYPDPENCSPMAGFRIVMM